MAFLFSFAFPDLAPVRERLLIKFSSLGVMALSKSHHSREHLAMGCTSAILTITKYMRRLVNVIAGRFELVGFNRVLGQIIERPRFSVAITGRSRNR